MKKEKKTRQTYNLECLDVIKEMIMKTPDLRFRQILSILGLDSDKFYEEPQTTYENIKQHLYKDKQWSVDEANDGDVLIYAPTNNPFIYNGNRSYDLLGGYCGIDGEGKFIDNENKFWCTDDVRPATQKQRDMLFQKMIEAGYIWDAANRELKKMPEKKEYINTPPEKAYINVQHEFDKRFDKIADKLTDIYGKLSDIYEVLTKPYMLQQPQMPTTNPIPGMDVWYKTHGIDKVPPVTCNLDQNANYTQTYSNNVLLG